MKKLQLLLALCIVLLLNLNLLAQQISTSATSVNFGKVEIGESLTDSVFISNFGVDTLRIDSLKLNSAQFTVINLVLDSNEPIDLKLGDSLKIVIGFSPDQVGIITDSLVIYNNDVLSNIVLTGTGTGNPEIRISTPSIFVELNEGDEKQGNVSITNDGNIDLIYNLSTPGTEGIYFSAFPIDNELTNIRETKVVQHLDIKTFLDTTIILSEPSTDTRIVTLAYHENYLYFQDFYARDTISVFNLSTEEIERSIQLPFEEIISSLSHNGDNLLAASGSEILEIDDDSGEIVRTVLTHDIAGLVFISTSKDRNELYLNTDDGVISVYDLTDGSFKKFLINSGYTFFDFSYSYAKNKLIVFGRNIMSDTYLFSMDLDSGELTDSTLFDDFSIQALASDEVIHQPFFQILSALVDTLSPGESTQIEYLIDATYLDNGNYASRISVFSNDTLQPKIDISVDIEAIGGPEILVTPESFVFELLDDDSIRTNLSIANVGFSELGYSIRAATRRTNNDRLTYYGASQDDFNHIVKYQLEVENDVYTIDTLWTGAFGAFGIRGLTLLEGDIYFISDSDDFEIVQIDTNSGEIKGTYPFEGFIEMYTMTNYKDGLIGISSEYDAETNQHNRYVVTMDLKNGIFPDTLIYNLDSITQGVNSIAYNPNEDAIYLKSISRIEKFDLKTKELSLLVNDEESYWFYHIGYSYSNDRIFVFAEEINQFDGQDSRGFIEYTITGDFESFTYFFDAFFSEIAFDETGAIAYLKINSDKDGVIEAEGSDQINFSIQTIDLDSGEYEAELIANSNDLDAPELRIPIHLDVIKNPILSISFTEIGLEVVEFEEVQGQFKLSNTGKGDLNYKFRTELNEIPNPNIKQEYIYYTSDEISEAGEFTNFVRAIYPGFQTDTLAKLPIGLEVAQAMAVTDQQLLFYDSNNQNLFNRLSFLENKFFEGEDVLDVSGIHVYSMAHGGDALYALIQNSEAQNPNDIDLVKVDPNLSLITDTLLTIDGLVGPPFIALSVNPIDSVLYLGDNTDIIHLFDLKTNSVKNESFTLGGEVVIYNVSYSFISNTVFATTYDWSTNETILFQLDAESGELLNSTIISNRFVASLATNEFGFMEFIQFDGSVQGTIPKGESLTIDYLVSSEHLSVGDYSGELIINSNDPEKNNIIIPVTFEVVPFTSNQEENSLPTDFQLSQNYPNPFNPSTQIEYALPMASHVEIKVFNVLGQEVVSLVNSYLEAGRYTVTFDARRSSSGVYFYQMKVDGELFELKKMMLIK